MPPFFPIELRERSRQQPDAPAEAAGLSASYLSVLRAQRKRPVLTVRDVFYALAGLSGHRGRTSDGPPGWQTLWLGLMSLRQFVEGVRLAASLNWKRTKKSADLSAGAFPKMWVRTNLTSRGFFVAWQVALLLMVSQ